MKKNVIVLCILGLVFLMAGICQAATYYGPIVMVEADPCDGPLDGETDVSFTLDFWDNWTLGEWTGSFVAFSDNDGDSSNGIQVAKVAGTVVDFAIQSSVGNVLKLSDGSHMVEFLNPNGGNLEAPTWITVWYDDATIQWNGGPLVNIEIVTTDGDPDGLAPAVPIPSVVLLLGSGLVGLVGFRKKFRS